MKLAPWFYDFKRALKSRSLIITTAFMLALLSAVVSNNTNYPPEALANIMLNVSAVRLFVGIISVMAAFTCFGNERINGVLDYILSKPISRTSLVLSRFISALCALSVAVALSLIIIDDYIRVLTGATLPLYYLTSMIVAFTDEIASILAIMFIVSYIVKSTSVFLGIGIGIFVMLTFLWQLIVSAIDSTLGNALSENASIRSAIFSFFLSPTQIPELAYVQSTSLYGVIGVDPSSYGLTLLSVSVAEALWVVVPLVILIILVKKLD
ncbi:MAG: ABC transporter permease subunit [Nitrososphaerales archaeon]